MRFLDWKMILFEFGILAIIAPWTTIGAPPAMLKYKRPGVATFDSLYQTPCSDWKSAKVNDVRFCRLTYLGVERECVG